MSHTGLSLEFGSAAAREVAGRRDVAGRRRVARDHVPRLREPREAVGRKALRRDARDEDRRRLRGAATPGSARLKCEPRALAEQLLGEPMWHIELTAAEAEQLEELAKQEASREEARSAADAERRKERAERARTINESLQRVRRRRVR